MQQITSLCFTPLSTSSRDGIKYVMLNPPLIEVTKLLISSEQL